jgi:hypothetical protein
MQAQFDARHIAAIAFRVAKLGSRFAILLHSKSKGSSLQRSKSAQEDPAACFLYPLQKGVTHERPAP